MHRASSRDMNQFSFRHSCRSLPLNDCTVALSVGVLGREKSIRIPRSYTHLSSIFPANSEPLSVFSNCGKGRLSAMVFSISATSVERRFWPTQIPRHSRVNKSITVSRRSRRPSNSASETKSAPDTIRIQPLRLWLSPLCRFIAMGTFETQGQALLAVETVNAFMVIPPALPPEQDVNPPITVMHAGFRDLTDTQAQCTVIGRHRAVTERTAADLQRKTDLPFAGPVTRLQLPDPFTQPCQRQVFFASTSCSIALSRLRSATSFFSRRFSSSS